MYYHWNLIIGFSGPIVAVVGAVGAKLLNTLSLFGWLIIYYILIQSDGHVCAPLVDELLCAVYSISSSFNCLD
jgi:hypothetical protein